MFRWTLHQSVLTSCDYSQAVVFQGHVYAFGRNPQGEPIEVNVFNTVSLRWRKLIPAGTGEERRLDVPPNHWGYTAVLIGGTAYLWGGRKTRVIGKALYAFDIDARTWFKRQVSGDIPELRMRHSACVFREMMIIHGGMDNELPKVFNDTYKLDTRTMVWTFINARGTGPKGTGSHSATVMGTKMFVFGGWKGRSHGYSEDRYSHSIRVFDVETNLWLDKPSPQLGPEGRCCHSAFTYNGEMYIFGGNGSSYELQDLWRFSSETFTWKKVEAKGLKGPHYTYKLCCCMVGDRVILFGGCTLPNGPYVLDLSPSLKTLCKLAVIQYVLDQSGLPHNIRWELAAMTNQTKCRWCRFVKTALK